MEANLYIPFMTPQSTASVAEAHDVFVEYVEPLYWYCNGFDSLRCVGTPGSENELR